MDKPIENLADAARAVLRAQGYFVDILWHVDDVLTICENHGWGPLTLSECMEIFTLFRKQFDGEQGMSWPKLEQVICHYMKQQSHY